MEMKMEWATMYTRRFDRQTTKQCHIEIDHDGSIAPTTDHVCKWLHSTDVQPFTKCIQSVISIVICLKSCHTDRAKNREREKKRYVNEGSKAFENIYQNEEREREKKFVIQLLFVQHRPFFHHPLQK